MQTATRLSWRLFDCKLFSNLSPLSLIFKNSNPPSSATHLDKYLHSSVSAINVVCKRKSSSSIPPGAIKSRYPDVEIPEITITDFLLTNFKKYGDKTALINGITGERISFSKFQDLLWRVGSALYKQGIKKGETVLMISENSPEFLIFFHAVLSTGATVTMVNPHYLADDILLQAKNSDATTIYASRFCCLKAIDVAKAHSKIKKIFTIGDEPGCIPFSYLASDDGKSFQHNLDVDVKNDVAILPYSSGTTGLPKGVMLTHHNEVANACQSDVPGIMFDKETAIQLAILPFYHIYAIIVYAMAGLSWGVTTVVLPSFDPKLFLENLQKYQVTMTHVVPPIVLFLNKHPMVQKYDLSRLERLVSAAAPLGLDMIQELHDKYPNCVIGQGYGMTETGPAVCITSADDCRTRPSSSGTLLPNTFVKVIGDDGQIVKKGERGEICVKGPQIMKGYHKNQEATDNMIKDGWCHTGDIVYMDEDDHVYVVDRLKELIKYKGLQVPPAELEAILCTHTSVSDAAVIGVPDAEAGELPKAFVSLKADSKKISEEELAKYVDERVVSYKRLRGGIVFIPQIPRSPSGKILRKDLKNFT